MYKHNIAAAALKLNIHTRILFNGIIRYHKLGKNNLYANLRYWQVLQDYPNKNIPNNEFIEKGYFTYCKCSRNSYPGFKAFVTERGMEWLEYIMKENIVTSEKEFLEDHYKNKSLK